MTPKIN